MIQMLRQQNSRIISRYLFASLQDVSVATREQMEDAR
jgi:hypothetical protein